MTPNEVKALVKNARDEGRREGMRAFVANYHSDFGVTPLEMAQTAMRAIQALTYIGGEAEDEEDISNNASIQEWLAPVKDLLFLGDTAASQNQAYGGLVCPGLTRLNIPEGPPVGEGPTEEPKG